MRIRSKGQARRRAYHVEEADAEGSWAISYGDMVTLLLTFFILFFNVNQKATAEAHKLQTAILAQLGSKANDQTKDVGNIQPRLNVGNVADSHEIDAQTLRVWGGKAHEIGSRILLEFPNVSFFEFGKTRVNRHGEAQLRKFAGRYLQYSGGNDLVIRAFTDGAKVRTPRNRRAIVRYEDNLELSALRAISAMRVLQKAGIPLNRMRISGNGELDTEIRRTLAGQPANGRGRGNPLARKVMLIIEPIVRESPRNKS